MKKINLSIAIATILGTSMSLQAANIMNDDTSSYSIGGRIVVQTDINVQGGSSIAPTADNGSSRLNFAFMHNFNNGWKARSKLEWQFNTTASTDAVALKNRLGWVALENEEQGVTFTAGKQYSPFYDVLEFTDYTNIYGDTDVSGFDTIIDSDVDRGTSGGFQGTGRSDSAVTMKYKKNDIYVGLQYQFTSDYKDSNDVKDEAQRDYGLAAGLGYSKTMENSFLINLGAAYSYVNLADNTNSISNYAVAAQVGFKGFKVDFAYGINQYSSATLASYIRTEQATYIEAGLQYQVLDNLNTFIKYQSKEDKEALGANQSLPIGFGYRTGPILWIAEYKLDINNSDNNNPDDAIALAVRYDF